jgi:hypothetical protein
VGGGTHKYRFGFDGRRDRPLSRKYHGREGLILRRLASEDGYWGEARHDDSLRCRVYRSVPSALDFGNGVRSYYAGQFRPLLAQGNTGRRSTA